MMTCQLCGEDERRCHCRKPRFDGDAQDEADELRRWRRDEAAEKALALPGAEPPTGVETISPPDDPAAGTKPTTNRQTDKPICN